jgi:hypothetical protein
MKKINYIIPFVYSPFTIIFCLLLNACGVYKLKDTSIDYSKIKTIKINFIENKARYVNPQLSPKLTDKLQQKIGSQTKLIRTTNDDANLVISGTITGYDVSTAAITTQQSTTNRLTVTVHVSIKNNVENKTEEYDVNRSFDFSANLSLQQAETQLLDEIVRTVSDEIFNHIFSNW